MCHLGLFEIFVSSWSKEDHVNSDHISRILTLHNLPSGLAAASAPKDHDLVLAVHDHRCVKIPLLSEKKYICFELYKIIFKALLSDVLVLKVHLILL